jgi:hypothetical protein
MTNIKRITRHVYQHFVRPGVTSILNRSQYPLDRVGLEAIADRWWEYGNEVQFQTDPPLGPEPTPSELSQKHRQLSIPAPFVCRLDNIELVGPFALPIDDQGRFVMEGSEGSTPRLVDSIVSAVRSGHLPFRQGCNRQFSRPIASLVGVWSTGFFHWFADYLPKVRGIEKYADETDIFPDVLIHNDAPQWQIESLEHPSLAKRRTA